MPQERTRKIVIAGVLSAITILLGITRWGFIPWLAGASLTIMHIPAILGAILEGPIVGLVIGLLFGLFSLLQAAIAPTGPVDVIFTNPVISILPRLFIGPVAWLVWRLLKRIPIIGLPLAGLAGSLTNTILVLGLIGIYRFFPWELLGTVFVSNGLPEAGISALVITSICMAWMEISRGDRQGADL